MCSLACLPFCLFVYFLAYLLATPIMLTHFMHFHMLFASFPPIAYLLVSCLCLCMYTHGVRMHGAKARSPSCKQKGHTHKHIDKPSDCVQYVQEFSLSLWLCTLLNPFIPPPFLFQMVCIRYIMPCTIHPHLQSMATPVYFLSPIFWAMLQGCRHLLSYSMCLHCA